MGQIAFLMLMGIVMKNGILLVDYINTLRARGASAARGGARGRPDAHAPGADDGGLDDLRHAAARLRARRRLGVAQPDGHDRIGGLVTSTLLTLLVVPVVYTLVDDAQTAVVRALRTLRSRSPAPR